MFLTVKNDAYRDYCQSSQVRFKTMNTTGYSSPFTGNVYLNLDIINRNHVSKKAVLGYIAHELAHQVSYRKRSFFARWFFLWNINLSWKKRRIVETEADKITIERGYGKELLAERKTSLKRWSKNKTRLHQKTKVYLSPQEIQRLLN